LFPGGKRLRPALAFAAAEAGGGRADQALPAAVAVELVHTYSLIHDELPCMDDDSERRGRPTVHVAYGESTAVLAGDALLAAAFQALATGTGDAQRRLDTVAELARAAGAPGLVGGQVDDLEASARTREAIEDVHARKTAALIEASVCGGARLAGADASALERLSRAGRAAGIAFQIADDLLDADDSDGCSVLRALGEPAARERAQVLTAEALAALEDFGAGAEPLRALVRYAIERHV
jgi:geranylgeranyl diphosphate synthase type II